MTVASVQLGSVWLLTVLVMLINFSMAWSRFQWDRQRDEAKAKVSRKFLQRQRVLNNKPNIIVILTDDQDMVLGSTQFMPKMQKILAHQGATFVNSFVSTPMCCPSRSSFLTGMYAHNHYVFTNNDNCSSIQWQKIYEPQTFAPYLNDQGYRTGYFGKYLNDYDGTYIPPGWREWAGLVRNSRFYNYTINFNGKKIKHGDNYYEDYYTDLIANDSVTFLKQSKQYFPNKPVLMMLSVPAPHGPEDSAPQYQHLFTNVTTHRTKSWNFAPNKDKQWLLQNTNKMEPIHQIFTDTLHQKRLQTLQSVDDLVEKVFKELQILGELDNTYIIYTSDHGYHLGQFGLVKGKAMPYDFDVRVPLYIRGPGIKPGTKINNLVVNVDIAPTILDMAGIEAPKSMDGSSVLWLLRASQKSRNLNNGFIKKRKPWRDTILLERGKVTKKVMKELDRKEKLIAKFTKTELQKKGIRKLDYNYLHGKGLMIACSKPQFQGPCKIGQLWVCHKEASTGHFMVEKCRNRSPTDSVQQNIRPCHCPPLKSRVLDRQERRNQRQFIKTYVNKENFKPRFIRQRRSLRRLNQYHTTETDDDFDDPFTFKTTQIGVEGYRKCRVLPNSTVLCNPEVYRQLTAWRSHKNEVDEMIQKYRQKLESLKGIRKHLKQQKPARHFPDSDYDDAFLSPDEELEEEKDGECDCSKVQLFDSTNRQSAQFDSEDNNYDSVTEEVRPMWKRGKMSKKHWRKLGKRKRKKIRRGCQMPNWNCFIHDNDHWKTPPYWTSPAPASKRRRGGTKRSHPSCKQENRECFIMDNNHWKTPPYWTYGPFCSCVNSNTNTYWCLRTINETHSFLYCEFITNYISYYDLRLDPDQLVNRIHDLNYGILQQLHETLVKLRKCKGMKDCSLKSDDGFYL